MRPSSDASIKGTGGQRRQWRRVIPSPGGVHMMIGWSGFVPRKAIPGRQRVQNRILVESRIDGLKVDVIVWARPSSSGGVNALD